jgi:hypothetical protein
LARLERAGDHGQAGRRRARPLLDAIGAESRAGDQESNEMKQRGSHAEFG